MSGFHRHARLSARLVLRSAACLLLFVVLGNVAIFGVSTWAKRTAAGQPLAPVAGVDNLRAVDSHLWRGSAPTITGYRSLADRGVTTVVDLRAEEGIEHEHQRARDLGLNVVHIPIRDGQTPSADKIDAVLDTISRSSGIVYLHCGAGVGRTGTLAAAYLVSKGGTDSMTAMRLNLSVGPPSLEQLAFVAGLSRSDSPKPAAVLVAASRVLDAPRRLWSRIG